MRLLKELLPHLCVDLTSSVSDLRALFGGHASSCWLEIGFGSGGHLVRTAAENPNVGFIGCEQFVNGMAKALAAIEAQGLTNIRLFEGDAADLLAWLPKASVGCVFLLFPDPWQ